MGLLGEFRTKMLLVLAILATRKGDLKPNPLRSQVQWWTSSQIAPFSGSLNAACSTCLHSVATGFSMIGDMFGQTIV